ncbi:hypothetical protein BU26DRAFT_516338 [Trematosphaeria pertusa]|uniref:DUF1330 domain-containing protein n=1 Tax=Trematosphaeria pertusa TaxID=390896 RepID=A0A6A6IV38_9PLEO|nr:uncharacterized protein BU26DRAFT_516338 [Trematosphaeria pertusa]KAF2254098.1 hypothetical protein BU26DRAFT_516338 [Trematosphaeria pertusa]
MPLCTLHLLALHPSTPNPLQNFLSTLQSSNVFPLVISRVIRWIILPETFSTEHLLARNVHWDLLVILPSTSPLPKPLQNLIQHHWTVTAGIPSRLLQDFAAKNRSLLHPDPATVPKLSGALKKPKTTDSAQDLELSTPLSHWIRAFHSSPDNAPEGTGAVSMLNLLSFKPDMKSSYLEYGKAFTTSIGKNRGGNAKLVGSVTEVNGVKKGHGEECWDEIALAHYPSILHFADMLASEDYQRVNRECRMPALRDTCILMTSEVGVEEIMGGGKTKGKL